MIWPASTREQRVDDQGKPPAVARVRISGPSLSPTIMLAAHPLSPVEAFTHSNIIGVGTVPPGWPEGTVCPLSSTVEDVVAGLDGDAVVAAQGVFKIS